MCGIAGIISLDGKTADPGTAEKMADTLAHRGPDGHGTYHDGAIAFAHRRLSILDVDGGAQPMTSGSGKTVVTYNGEIYNFRDLAEELSGDYRFKTQSDTEVILAAYEKWGTGAFRRLQGMFAFALFDKSKRKVFLVRDPMGIKPLYTARIEDRLLFSSEMKALLVGLRQKPSLSVAAVNSYFSRQYIGRESTIYEGIEAHSPGAFSTIDLRDGGVTIENFWRLPCDRPISVGVEEASERLEELLTGSIQKHLVSDVPVGLFLSGGLDSSTLLAIANGKLNAELSTFSVGFRGAKYDESNFASSIARKFNAKHHSLAVDADSGLEFLPELIKQLDQPLADYAILPTYVMSRFAAEHVKVVLGGEGADEIFAGYKSRYLPHYLAGRSLSAFAPKTLLSPLVFWDRQRRSLLGERFVPLRNLASERALRADLTRFRDCGPLNAALHTDVGHWLPDNLLAKVDSMGMLASLEARVPFLDTTLVSEVASWPASVKYGLRENKKVLRHLGGRLLPEGFATRKKHGFTVPVGEWFRGKLKERFSELLFQPGPAASWINEHEVRKIWNQHQNGKDNGLKLWSLFVFAWWLEAHG